MKCFGEPDFAGLVLLCDFVDDVVEVDLAGRSQNPHRQHTHLPKAGVQYEIKLV
jgi:hypothetical protein